MRGLLLLMIVAATLPMAFMRPIVGLILWIGFSYMNPHRITWGFATAFPWVMIVALVTLTSMVVNKRQCQRMPMTPLSTLLVLFLVWTGVCAIFAIKPELAHPKWIEFFKILLMAFATLMLAPDRQRLDWVIWAIVLSFGFWGFKGGAFTILSGGGYHVLGPAHSFFHDNNEFALVMCMTLPLMRYLQLHEKRRYVRYGLWALMGLTAVSVIGTYSRGGFLALGIVAVMLVLKSRQRVGLLFVGAALVVALASFMPQKYVARLDTIHNFHQNKSAMGRIHSWEFATELALAHPFTGGGFEVWASDRMWNTYGPPGATHRAIHSIFFEVLAEQGFVGLGLFLALLWVGWRRLSRIKKLARGAEERRWMGDLAGMMQVSLTGFAAAGSLLPMPYFDLFYQLLALTVVLGQFAIKSLREPQSEALVAGEPGFFTVFKPRQVKMLPSPKQQAKSAPAATSPSKSAPSKSAPARKSRSQSKPAESSRSKTGRPASASGQSSQSGLRHLPRW